MNPFQMNQIMNMNNTNNQSMPNQFSNINNFNNNQFMMNQNLNMNIINPMQNMNNQLYQNIYINNNINEQYPINQINEPEDVLPYIHEPKLILKFSTISTIKDGTFISVKLPKSITKKDLYSIAKKYQVDYYSNIILTCNNYLLKEEDTSIEGIKEGSIINIIEDINFPDGSYYRELMKKYENYEKTIFNFKVDFKFNSSIEFPNNITVKEMEKAALSNLLLNPKSYRILEISSPYIKISDLPKGRLFNIIQSDPLIPHWRFGKKIATFFKGENITIGILNSINQLAKEIEFYPPNKKVKKLIIGGNEYLIEKNNNFSLKSLGLTENFNCEAEYYD